MTIDPLTAVLVTAIVIAASAALSEFISFCVTATAKRRRKQAQQTRIARRNRGRSILRGDKVSNPKSIKH